jgi:hypothetical protein
MAEAEEALVTEERPDLVRQGRERLGFMERSIVRFVRGTFEPGVTDRSVRFLQRVIGSTWIHHFTKHLRHVYGEDRLPPLDPEQSCQQPARSPAPVGARPSPGRRAHRS